MAAEGDNVIRFTYTLHRRDQVIPREATHIFVQARVVEWGAFILHQNIVEVICHEDVEKIEAWAFDRCPSLRRVVMPNVKVVEFGAFCKCRALEHLECDNLEMIGEGAFSHCLSLRNINLPSARIVRGRAFRRCYALTDVKFGSKLVRIGERTFWRCESLERITIPLKVGLNTSERMFMGCRNLPEVHHVVGELHEIVDNNIVRYIYRGEQGEVIPDEVTHILVQAKVIRRNTFSEHPNIVEVICHENVEKIEALAFYDCYSLRRVIMRGVKVVEAEAFEKCELLEDVECDKLEIVGNNAFFCCDSLRSMNLPSARIVEEEAFCNCFALMNVKFGSKLRSIGEGAFYNCESLGRITIPLKDGLFNHDDIFQGCVDLHQVGLIEGGLHETIAAFYLEEWRNDVNEEIDSINQILPDTAAGTCGDDDDYDVDFSDDDDDDDDNELDPGEKAQAIQRWVRSVSGEINRYHAEYCRFLEEYVATTLVRVLTSNDVVNNVLPFLELPPYTFEVEDDEDEGDDSDDGTQSSGRSLGNEEEE